MTAMRMLFAAVGNSTDPHGDGLLIDDHGDDHGGSHPFTFEELIALLGTLWVIVIFGKLAPKIGLPALVGEIMAGILIGPHGIDLAPKPTSLMLIGEVGLLLMVLEAGIEVDLGQLALVGARGVVVAVVGSLLPLMLGFGFATIFFGMEIKSALAVGATLAPTSMGISLKVLQEGNVLNTPTGQLIIAAAVIDDVIALVLLSELEALEDPSAVNFIVPVVASLAFILVVGFAAVKIIPGVLANQVVPRLPPKSVEMTLLGLVLAVGVGLVAATHYGKSSHLLGAFLGGLCFCTLVSVEHVWRRKVHAVMSWLVRIFFACTIGFEVPIRDLWTSKILGRAAVFVFAGFGKLATGAFARPFNFKDASTIGWAMAAWGEFAFIVATTSREAGTLDEDTYGAVVLAVLLSTVYSPLMVKSTCAMKAGGSFISPRFLQPLLPILPIGAANRVRLAIAEHEVKMEMEQDPDMNVELRMASEMQVAGRHSVYYACTVRCRSRWGLTDKLLGSIQENMTIVDFRVHTSHGFSQYLLYLSDKDLLAPLEGAAEPDDVQIAKVEERKDFMRAKIQEILGEVDVEGAATILFEQWKPTLDDERSYLDNEEAYEQAQLLFHEEYPDEKAKKISDEQAKGVNRRMQRAGSMVHLRHLVQSDAEMGILDALEQGSNQRKMENAAKERMDRGSGAARLLGMPMESAQVYHRQRLMERGNTRGRTSIDRYANNPAYSPSGGEINAMTVTGLSGSALAKELRRKIDYEKAGLSPGGSAFARKGSTGSGSATPNGASGSRNPARPNNSGNSSMSGRTPDMAKPTHLTLSGASGQALAKELHAPVSSGGSNSFKARNGIGSHGSGTHRAIPSFSPARLPSIPSEPAAEASAPSPSKPAAAAAAAAAAGGGGDGAVAIDSASDLTPVSPPAAAAAPAPHGHASASARPGIPAFGAAPPAPPRTSSPAPHGHASASARPGIPAFDTTPAAPARSASASAAAPSASARPGIPAFDTTPAAPARSASAAAAPSASARPGIPAFDVAPAAPRAAAPAAPAPAAASGRASGGAAFMANLTAHIASAQAADDSTRKMGDQAAVEAERAGASATSALEAAAAAAEASARAAAEAEERVREAQRESSSSQ